MLKTLVCSLLCSCLPLVCFSEELKNIEVFQLLDSEQKLEIGEVLKGQDFSRISDLNTLNLGFTDSNHWIKLVIRELNPSDEYQLTIATIVPDTIEVYQKSEQGYRKTFIGEAFPTTKRFLNYTFRPVSKEQILYLKIIGNGQPIVLPLNIRNLNSFEIKSLYEAILIGVIYGILFLILVLHLILFINTSERIYAYSLLFNFFSMMVLFYFDGMMKVLVFPNSPYWNNQSIAIAFCLSFIFSNLYISEFLNIRKNSMLFRTIYLLLNILFLFILTLSFWHPVGFRIYMIANVVLTTAEVILFSCCIFYVRNKEQHYFLIQLVGVVCLIVFGTIAQLYFLGVLPLHFITLHSVHLVVLSQILVQAVALGKRLAMLMREQSTMQTALIRSSEQYSHSLINTLEYERKRLSKEFHDSIGQNILVIRNSILKLRKKHLDPKLQEKFMELATITSQTLDEIREISQNLRPTTLDSIGLTASLGSMVHKLNEANEIVFDLDCPEPIDGVICKDLEINVYRILQELTTNIMKHSKANHATITIRLAEQSLVVVTKDNGQGFDAVAVASTNLGNGMSGIKERVNILKGKLVIQTAMNQGTTIHITIPKAP